jgi:hypothetical protein
MANLFRRKQEKIYKRIDSIATKGRDNILEYTKYIDELIDKGDYAELEQVLYDYYYIDIIDASDVEVIKKKTWDPILFQTTSSFLKKLSNLYKKKGVYQSSFDILTSDPNIIQIGLSQPLSITFSQTGYTQSISFTREEDVVSVNVLNSETYLIQISRADWENDLPINVEILQNINVGTQSSIKTQIPVTHSREYLVKTYERASFLELNYKLDIVKDNIIGQIREIDTYTADAKYYLKNQQYARIIGEVIYYLEVTDINGETTLLAEDDPYLSFDQNLLNRYNLAINILLANI